MAKKKKPKKAEVTYTLTDYKASKTELLMNLRGLIEQTEATQDAFIFITERQNTYHSILKLMPVALSLGLRKDTRLIGQLSKRLLHFPSEQPASVLLSVMDQLEEEGAS